MNQVRTLTVIWAAMLMMVTGFCGVAAFVVGQGEKGDALQSLPVVLVLGVASLAILGASFVVPMVVLKMGEVPPAKRAFQATVISLAMSEGSGLVIAMMAIATRDLRVLVAAALPLAVLASRKPSPEKLADLTLRADTGGGN